jgi:Bacterial regulatory helix-turn-helix protein, lysR family
MGRLRDMETFVRVVETGSFSATARDLKTGQPAISKTIAGLEEGLGVRLLVRSTRQLSPTEAGTDPGMVARKLSCQPACVVYAPVPTWSCSAAFCVESSRTRSYFKRLVDYPGLCFRNFLFRSQVVRTRYAAKVWCLPDERLVTHLG